jgi:hypothetical protein
MTRGLIVVGLAMAVGLSVGIVCGAIYLYGAS